MVINGADFGYTQRRRRVFIFAYKKNKKDINTKIFKSGFSFEQKEKTTIHKVDISKFNSILEVSKKYNQGKFLQYGEMVDGKIESL